jgi:DNA-binding SARP family transcriptional activator
MKGTAKQPLKLLEGQSSDEDPLAGKDLAYYRDVVDLISNLEKTLRAYLEPEKVLETILKMVCDFYAADWAGAIDIDFDLGIWTPFYWYSSRNGPMGETTLRTFEPTEDYARWVKAYKEQRIVFCIDIEFIRRRFPKEYESYHRMQVKSLIAAPYYKGSNGFLVIKNPRQYIHETSLIQILSYFVACEINDIRLIQNCLSHEPSKLLRKPRDVLISYFGGLSIETVYGRIPAKDFGRKEAARIIALLGLHPEKALASYQIFELLHPDAESADEISRIRYNIYNFHRSYGYALNKMRLVISTETGYILNPELHIITDLQLFDEAVTASSKVADGIHKTKLLRQALNLYTGPIFPRCSSEPWLMQTALHYERLFGETSDCYCRLLNSQKNYGTLCDFAESTLQFDSTRPETYYWIIYSHLKRHYRKAAKRELIAARENMDTESYQILLRHLHRHFPNYHI